MIHKSQNDMQLNLSRKHVQKHIEESYIALQTKD